MAAREPEQRQAATQERMVPWAMAAHATLTRHVAMVTVRLVRAPTTMHILTATRTEPTMFPTAPRPTSATTHLLRVASEVPWVVALAVVAREAALAEATLEAEAAAILVAVVVKQTENS